MKRVLTLLAVLAGLGVLAGVVWSLVVETPLVTRDTAGVVTTGPELAKQIDSDAWFAVLGLLVGAPSGVVVAVRGRLDPVVGVLTVVAGALLASWLCLWTGWFLGPEDPTTALRDAQPGATAPAVLSIHTWVVMVVWPLTAAIGALVVLLLRPPRLQHTTESDHAVLAERAGPEPDTHRQPGTSPA